MKLSYEWLKEYADIDVSAEELALGLTMSGSEVEAIHESDGDRVMDLEITSNRPDCLNIIGLAREAAVVFRKGLHLPVMSVPPDTVRENGPAVECIVENRNLCPRYTARVITGVRVGETGGEIRKRILAVGLRPVNNVVDITNFCLMETGQPLHAFDLDKIEGGKVIIREAVKGERIVTIDGVERELAPGMLVIADNRRAIAVAGIMGGKNTEVTENTRNILLESAYFDPVSVRRTARILGISSDSSYRFERGVDKGMIGAASDRASALISAETGGKICAFYDIGDLVPADVAVEFDVRAAEKLLGVPLEKEEVIRIFRGLGMEVSIKEGTKLAVRIPSFREDLRKETDLIEEVARIYGYDRIPETVARFVPQVRRKEFSRRVLEKLYEVLPAVGLDEIITYSLISEAGVKRFSDVAGGEPVALKNPLSEEQKVLTPQLLDGMLRTISWNINRKNRDLRFFEIGKIYSRAGEKNGFLEEPALCIGLTGALRRNWQDGECPAGFYDLKGIVETLLGRLRLSAVFYGESIKGLTNCAGIRLRDESAVGFLGEVNASVLREYDIAQTVYVCQLKLDKIMKKANLGNQYHTVPRFPSSSRDVSILCDKDLASGEIYRTITETGEEIIRGIELIDVYEGEQIPAGKKSLSYSIRYGLDTRTLTDEEVEAIHSKIKEALAKELHVTFR